MWYTVYSILSDYVRVHARKGTISEQIRSAILLLDEKWDKKHIELSADFEEYTITADEEMLEHVWINLLDNAVKFTPDFGEVRVDLAASDRQLTIHIRGYMENMSRLMDSMDVYLTKPGGIRVTEASVKKLPMVLINAVGGCEAYNYQFFMDMGTAVSGKDAAELADICVGLLRDDSRQNIMREKYDTGSFRTAGTVPETLYNLDAENKNTVMKYIAEEEGIPV